MPLALFVAGGNSGRISTSPDGITWTARTGALGSVSYLDFAWSSYLNLFVAVASVAVNSVATSPDGITWTARTKPSASTNAIVWSPTVGLFVTVGDSGKILTSADGTTWTARTSGTTQGLNAVVWSPVLALFVVVGNAGTVLTSPDGVTWTARTSGTTAALSGLAWNANGLVAGGQYGNGATSPDGITWTPRTLSTDYVRAIAWSPTLALFVAGGDTGTLATSPDGITWTPRTNGFGTGQIRALAWSPTLNLFVVTGGLPSGGAGVIQTSADGITWTARTSGFTSSIATVAWSDAANAAPYGPTLLTPASVAIDRSITQRLAWAFADPDYGDSQSKADVQYRLGAGPWSQVTFTTPNPFWDAPPATFPAGAYEWQVRTYDAAGLLGPWSASAFFTAVDAPPSPTITAPVSGATVSSTATVTWSAPNQAEYQYRRVADAAGTADTSAVYFDSGAVVDPLARSRMVAFGVNSRWEHVQARVKFSGLWSPWADIRVAVYFTAPAVPSVLAAADNATASVLVTVTNPTPTGSQPTVLGNDIYISSPLDPEYRAATGVPVNGSWRWWTPGSGRTYTITAVAIGDNATSTRSL